MRSFGSTLRVVSGYFELYALPADMGKPKIPRMKARVASQDSPQLLDRMRAEIRLHHYSLCTEKAYVDWMRCLLAATSGTMGLIVALLYGTGMRIRVKAVAMTMIRTHVPNQSGRRFVDPLDRWFLPVSRPLHRCPRRSPT